MKRSKTRQRRLDERSLNRQPVPAPPPVPVDLPDGPNLENPGPPVEGTAFARRDLFRYGLVVSILFLAIFWNVFHICQEPWFSTFQRVDENLVTDTMIRHRATSRVPAPVGLGTYSMNQPGDLPIRTADFQTSKEPPVPYSVYRSQIGAQSYAFVLLDTLFHPHGFSPFHTLNSLLLAAILGALVVWARATSRPSIGKASRYRRSRW
jgi:hypothetical protein